MRAVTVKRHYLNLKRSWDLSRFRPDIHLIILRLSFGLVKGNLITGRAFGARRRTLPTTLPTTLPHCGVEAPPAKSIGRKLNSSSGFAYEQTGFALGQVSRFRTG